MFKEKYYFLSSLIYETKYLQILKTVFLKYLMKKINLNYYSYRNHNTYVKHYSSTTKIYDVTKINL